VSDRPLAYRLLGNVALGIMLYGGCLAAVVSFLWLLLGGGWWVVLLGILAILIVPYLWLLPAAPAAALTGVTLLALQRDKPGLYFLFLGLGTLYICVLGLAWTFLCFTYSLSVISDKPWLTVPLLGWGFVVALSPLARMMMAERPEPAIPSLVLVLSCEVAYLTAIISFAYGWSQVALLVGLVVIAD